MQVREFVRQAESRGWAVRLRPGGHLELSHPLAARTVTTPATPSDRRWHLNALAEMRRALPPEPKPERPAAPRVRRDRIKAAPLRSWPEPLAMYRLPEPERREYPPEPLQRRLAGGPAGYKSCLDRV